MPDPIGDSILAILSLQSQWNKDNTPEMKNRGRLTRSDLPAAISAFLVDGGSAFGALKVEGRDGTGLKTRIPWVRIYDPQKSPHATEGWYAVFLFSLSGDSVFLSLNQGTTIPEGGAFKPRDPQYIAGRVAQARGVLREEIAEQPRLVKEISLQDSGPLGAGYEKGNVVAYRYSADSVPSDTQIREDLRSLLGLLLSLYDSNSENVVGMSAVADRLVELAEGRFPGWSFTHPSFVNDEIVYKRQAATKAQHLLSALELDRLIAVADFEEVARRIRTVAGLTNLLFLGVPSKGDLAVLNVEDLDKGALARAFRDLLHESGSCAERIGVFSNFLNKEGLPNKWPFATYFTFLLDPDRETIVKPTVAKWLLKLAGIAATWDDRPSERGYAQYRALMTSLAQQLKRYGEPTMVALQSLVWVAKRVDEGSEDMEKDVPDSHLNGALLEETATQFASALRASNVSFGLRHADIVRSFIASLATKRFAILTGLSGSGKTQLALRFGEWLGHGRYLAVPVRPDWTGAEALFGFEDALQPAVEGQRAWQVPDALRFMLRAARDPGVPYLLLLDEMNLAHVERYFADVLSGMESGQECLPNLQPGPDGHWRIVPDGPERLPIPDNLFIVGTVNVDETTYMFSPKVLDRANTFEFRVGSADLLADARRPIPCLPGDAKLVAAFAAIAADSNWHIESPAPASAEFISQLRRLHELLSPAGFEFGHRLFYEAVRFAALFAAAGDTDPLHALDSQVMQKLLPRLHGSRRRLDPVLAALGRFCFDLGTEPVVDVAGGARFDPLADREGPAKLSLSYDKIRRMTRILHTNQFVSFTE